MKTNAYVIPMRDQLRLFKIIAFLPKLALICVITDQATWYGKTSHIVYISDRGTVPE